MLLFLCALLFYYFFIFIKMSPQFLLNCVLLQLFFLKTAALCQNQARKQNQARHFMIEISTFFNVSCFYGFDSFADLMRANCNQTYNTNEYVQFSPQTKIIVDKTYDLTRLFDRTHLEAIEQITIANLKGYDLNTHALFSKKPEYIQKNMAFELVYSKFDVFSNGHLMDDCGNESAFTTRNHFLSQFNSLMFNQVIYPKSICPLLFRNSEFFALYFTKISNSYLAKNRLVFANSSSQIILKEVSFLAFELFYEDLNSDLLNEPLFKNTQNLNIVGCVNKSGHESI